MTDANIALNVRYEWSRADQALRAADLLAEHALIPDAVSRLYYSLLHSVRALLLTRQIDPRTHEGVLRMFSLRFVREGTFSPGHAQILSMLMKYRVDADYSAGCVFAAADYLRFRGESEELRRRILADLQSGGWLDPNRVSPSSAGEPSPGNEPQS